MSYPLDQRLSNGTIEDGNYFFRVYDYLGVGTGIFTNKKVSLIAYSLDNIQWKSYGILTNLVAADVFLQNPNFFFSLENAYFGNQEINTDYIAIGTFDQLFPLSHISTNIDSTIWSNYIVFFDIFDNSIPFISLQEYESIIYENPLRLNSLTSGEIGFNMEEEGEEKDISITSVAIIIFIIIFLSAFFTKSG